MMNDMNKLIEIYKLIDWNASAEDNKVGIDMAIKIDNLQFLFSPLQNNLIKTYGKIVLLFCQINQIPILVRILKSCYFGCKI